MNKIDYRVWDRENNRICRVITFGGRSYDSLDNKGWYRLCTVEYYDINEFKDTYDSDNKRIINTKEYHAIQYKLKIYEDDDNLMKYTGFNDKNNEKIYESDIIKFKDILDIPGHDEKICIINYIKRRSSLNPQEIKENTRGGHYLHLWSDIFDIEVIGNKFENPKLLKK